MLKPRQPKTLREAITKAIVSTLVAMAFLSVAAMLNNGAVSGSIDSPTVDAPSAPSIPQKPSRLERMVESGKCWTQSGPEGVIPTHAWFSIPGERLTYGPSDVAFAIVFGADNEMGTGDERTGHVSAFCR